MKLPHILVPRFNANTGTSRRSIKARVNMVTRRLQRRRTTLLIQLLISNAKGRRARMFTNNFISRQRALGLQNSASGFIRQRRMRTPFLTSNRSRTLPRLKTRFNQGHRATLNVSLQHVYSRGR